jgi:hypothetical protein
VNPARPRTAPALAFALGAVPLAVLIWRFAFVCDDAYISFRYSRHVAEGHGLVYNLSESPPVEGYSNLLWVLWIAPFERLGLRPELASCATSIVCALLLLALVLR